MAEGEAGTGVVEGLPAGGAVLAHGLRCRVHGVYRRRPGCQSQHDREPGNDRHANADHEDDDLAASQACDPVFGAGTSRPKALAVLSQSCATSWMFEIATSRVAPSAMQPGSSGASTK